MSYEKNQEIFPCCRWADAQRKYFAQTTKWRDIYTVKKKDTSSVSPTAMDCRFRNSWMPIRR